MSLSNLTLGIALDALAQTPLGFHRFEPVIWNDVAIAPGNVTYPTRNFATLGPFIFVTQRAFASRLWSFTLA